MRTTHWVLWIVVMTVVVAGAVAGCSSLTPVPPQPAPVHISGGTTTGPLKIRRVELQFSNGRAQITVPGNSKLTARALIQFNGNGLFRATWLVDDIIVGIVSTTVTYGDTLTIDTAPEVVLPTLEPGLHRLMLRVEEPASALTMPAINYMVTVSGNSDGGTGKQ